MVGILGNIMSVTRLPDCPVVREQYAWDEDIVTIEGGASGRSRVLRLDGGDQGSYDSKGEGKQFHSG